MCINSSIVVFVNALPESKPKRQETTNCAVDKELVVGVLCWFMILSDVLWQEAEVKSETNILQSVTHGSNYICEEEVSESNPSKWWYQDLFERDKQLVSCSSVATSEEWLHTKDDEENASHLLGKTAYYDPNNKSITLYTMNRHPKDVLRSFAHEMIHHEQNLDGRLNNINTTNTNESGDLPEIEREAYEKGNMMLRNWEDKIKNV